MNWIKIANYCWTLLILFGVGCKRSFHFRCIILFGLGCIKWFYLDLVHNIHKSVANGVAVLIYIKHSWNWYYFLVNHQTKTLTLATSLKFYRTYTHTQVRWFCCQQMKINTEIRCGTNTFQQPKIKWTMKMDRKQRTANGRKLACTISLLLKLLNEN